LCKQGGGKRKKGELGTEKEMIAEWSAQKEIVESIDIINGEKKENRISCCLPPTVCWI
jgi:hypothetical protein